MHDRIDEPLFTLTHDDWSLHRKGELDQERHQRKVKEAIQKQLSDLLQDDSIYTSQNGQILKVPIKTMDEPRFRYNHNPNAPHLGQGKGDTSVGDIIGRAAPEQNGKGSGQGQAGDQAGEDVYEAEISLEELSAIVFEGWELPRLKPRSKPQLQVEDIRFNDVRRKGMMSNVDKRRTLMEAIKRQAMQAYLNAPIVTSISQESSATTELSSTTEISATSESIPTTESIPTVGINKSKMPVSPIYIPDPNSTLRQIGAPVIKPFKLGPITNDDLRFKTWETTIKPQASATVLAMMDTSGSMGNFEKRIARTFFYWMVRFLRTKYAAVQIRFLAHHTEAKEVSEEQFFYKGESGGTKVSSVYALANQIVQRDYPDPDENIYAFHFSDGDNYDSDNLTTVQLVWDLIERVNMLGYGEIHQHSRTSGLWDAMSSVKHDAYYHSLLREPKDVYRTLRECFAAKQADQSA